MEYDLIKGFYGDKTAERSKVPLINHIDEGVELLRGINASDYAIRAYMLHPYFQGDNECNNRLSGDLSAFNPNVLVRVMEYRRAANAYLCRPETDSWTLDEVYAHVGPLHEDIRHMLWADKKQNQKDFLTYHYGTHKRSVELKRYFETWLTYLDVR